MKTLIKYRRSMAIKLACVLILTTGIAGAGRATAHEPGEDMAVAATRFITSLDAKQKAMAVFDFKDDKRRTWHFLPDRFIPVTKGRSGLPFKEMNSQQRALAQGLLATGLSSRGYLQAMTVVSMEKILHDLEKKNPIRDSDLYYVSIYGTPSAKGNWFWRFEGHHLSINVTIVGGKLFAVTPSFFGANPGEVRDGAFKGLRVLAEEEDQARKLVESFSPEQKKLAVIATKAPRDVITKWDRKVDRGPFTPAKGIAFDQLDAKQQVQLIALIETFATKYRKELVDGIDARKKLFDGRKVYFAWAGSTKAGEGHYYRIQTPVFLFEYDNTQNGANHIHTVWRDFAGDFGEDLLRKHYEDSHGEK